MTDELDEYAERGDAEQALVTELADEAAVADADEILDLEAEREDTPFDDTRREYSGVGDDDVDVEELEEAGALFDDPEREALLGRAMDDPDGSDP